MSTKTASPGLSGGAVASLALLALACGDDNTLTQEEASRAFAEVMTLSQSVGTEAQACTDCNPTAVYSASGSFPCPGGGTADYDGEVDDGGPITMDLDLDYLGCTGPSGVTVDGNMDYTTSIAVAGDFSFSMLGSMQFSGAVSGSCNFDLSLSLTSGAYAASGDLCGNTFSYP